MVLYRTGTDNGPVDPGSPSARTPEVIACLFCRLRNDRRCSPDNTGIQTGAVPKVVPARRNPTQGPATRQGAGAEHAAEAATGLPGSSLVVRRPTEIVAARGSEKSNRADPKKQTQIAVGWAEWAN